MNRDELISVLNVASLALAPEKGTDIPKVFQEIAFTGAHVVTYNDVVSVRMKYPSEFVGLVPGRLLQKFLGSCTGKEVRFTNMQKESKWRVQCGPTKLDLAVDDIGLMPFTFPKVKKGEPLDKRIFDGLDLCSSIIGDKGLVAWTSGVVCKSDHVGKKDCILLGSTSASRNVVYTYSISGSKLDIEDTVVLPLRFCTIALAMSKMFPDVDAVLNVVENYAIMSFGSIAAVFGKLIVPEQKVELLDKAKDWQALLENYVSINDKVREVIGRAASVADSEDTGLLSIEESDGNGSKMTLTTKVTGGVVRDAMTLTAEHPSIKVRVVPRLINTHIGRCSEFAVVERLIGMRSEDGSFVRLVANKGG
jgi:uncharacterized protein YwbE